MSKKLYSMNRTWLGPHVDVAGYLTLTLFKGKPTKTGEGELSRWSSSRQMADDKSADIKMRQRLTAEHVSVCIADPVRYLFVSI